MTLHDNYIGCDIAKHYLDLFDPASGRTSRVANEKAALEELAASLEASSFVVFEATGSHDRLLRLELARTGIACARLNPTMVRRFAQARGRRAKTDNLDARTLAEIGQMFKPAAAEPLDTDRERLAALARRRDQLVDIRADEKKHLSEAFDDTIRADIEAVIASLSARIKTIETLISRQMKAAGELAAKASRLVSAPGVGPVTALAMIAHMPELGRTSPGAIASLAGLAPFNNDSGQRKGRRSIRGGRPRVRRALYMAALGAIKAADRFKAFYNRVAKTSGSKKCAIIAVARKLLTILNAMIRDNKNYA